MFSATDIDPRPGAPRANAAAYRRLSMQVKTPPRRGRRWSFADGSAAIAAIRIPMARIGAPLLNMGRSRCRDVR